ncbi:MAG: nickel pincer cofactor biosynthesis protein LarC [Deltaproteobacteria bacterium]|nr:nickel pincer cofactor biosynthesis protein LarC [Deltaproteobacteria bacterium]
MTDSGKNKRDHGHAHGEHGHSHGTVERCRPLERGCGRNKLLFLDAFSGISGDMTVAALIDLGVPREVVTRAVDPLPMSGYRIEFGASTRSAIRATRFDVLIDSPQPSRDWRAIRNMLSQAEHLPQGARHLALRAFGLLAQAESEVHGVEIEKVHFHEVGAVDSIVDIVAAAVCFDYIGAAVVCSPLPIGRGMIACEHGALPSPAPATLLCLRAIPTFDAGIDAELVTPTGACLVAATATAFSRWPSLASEKVGWGAGSRELVDRPNLLRVVLGSESETRPKGVQTAEGSHILLEANVDDMSGEIIAYALQSLLEAGASDAWTTPIGMKKGRPALMISALAPRAEADRIARVMLSETTTLGVRLRAVGRIERKRITVEVQTQYGNIAIKIGKNAGLPDNIAPEYEDCRKAAETHGVPLKLVYAQAIAAYLKKA